MAKTQANNDAPGIGHNAEQDTAELKAVMMDHFRKISAQKARVDAEAEIYKKLRKDAKADSIVLADIDFMMKCADVEDPSIIPAELKRRVEIASWFALPVEYQPDMFGDFSREPSEDLARRQGRAAGASGVGSNPYDEDSASGRAWAEEWQKEQKKLQAALQSAMEKRNAAAELIKGSDDEDLDDEKDAA
jgi:hypothetical protein